MLWHATEADSVAQAMHADPVRGLTQVEAARRLVQHGPNELAHEERASALALFFSQFRNTLVVILLAATVLSAFLGEVADAAIILAIVIFCAVLGFVQEWRAGQALDALKRMLASTITVLRDGVEARIAARDVVPGDILLLEAGDRIPADARLLEAHSLKCDEAPLTGESFPVDKEVASVAADAALADRRNVIFTGTTVTYGRGKAVVTSTGMGTEFGRIAKEVSAAPTEKTPLEKRTEEIGRWLGLIAVAVCGVAVLAGVARAWVGGTLDLQLLLTMTMFAIALAVAAVPEALAAIVTGALAVGMHEMAKRNALVRRMPVVETLGCTTVICSDKTGTLTKGEMTARRLYVDGQSIDVGGAGYAPAGDFRPALAPHCEAARLMLAGAVLCNDSSLVEEEGRWRVKGDPTEAALVVLAAKAGLNRNQLRSEAPRLAELPFSSERKRMTTVNRLPEGGTFAFVKGAPETILERCTGELRGVERRVLDDGARGRILGVSERMARDALRVLAIACKRLPEDAAAGDALEDDLVFLGLVGMMDPPREEAIAAVRTCRQVHIKPVMITGDHRLTAMAVAAETGIYLPGDKVLTGAELAAMGEGELERIVDQVSVYARVSPTDKLKIVRAWKSRGHVVAMTGDGVNDAPALKHADIGIAMGITGTDVAKEAADMVLADDNFATIVRAIERGRWIYDNIRKYLTYLLRANVTEVLVLGGVVIVTGPELLPLLPAAILYINLASDGLPALALGLAPADRDIMRRPPRDPSESIFSRDVRALVLLGVVIETPILLWVYFDNVGDIETARTRIFLLFVAVELAIALCLRSLRYSVIEAPPHKWLLAATAWEIVLLVVLLQFPAVRETFGIRMPTAQDLSVALGIAALVAASIEITKAHLRRRSDAIAPAPASRKGGTSMSKRILVPVDRSANCRLAVQQAIKQFINEGPLEIHLVNVQPPFSRHVAQFASRRNLQAFHDAEAAKALRPCVQMLDKLAIPHAVHVKVGDRAKCITDLAGSLPCDLILMATARKNSLTRLLEDSVTNHVIELTHVPVEVIAGDEVSRWERYGIPAAIAGGVAAAVAAIVD